MELSDFCTDGLNIRFESIFTGDGAFFNLAYSRWPPNGIYKILGNLSFFGCFYLFQRPIWTRDVKASVRQIPQMCLKSISSRFGKFDKNLLVQVGESTKD